MRLVSRYYNDWVTDAKMFGPGTVLASDDLVSPYPFRRGKTACNPDANHAWGSIRLLLSCNFGGDERIVSAMAYFWPAGLF